MDTICIRAHERVCMTRDRRDQPESAPGIFRTSRLAALSWLRSYKRERMTAVHLRGQIFTLRVGKRGDAPLQQTEHLLRAQVGINA